MATILDSTCVDLRRLIIQRQEHQRTGRTEANPDTRAEAVCSLLSDTPSQVYATQVTLWSKGNKRLEDTKAKAKVWQSKRPMKAISRVALAQVYGIMVRGNKICLWHSLPCWHPMCHTWSQYIVSHYHRTLFPTDCQHLLDKILGYPHFHIVLRHCLYHHSSLCVMAI